MKTRTDVAYRLISLPLYLVERLPSLLAALPLGGSKGESHPELH